MVEQELRKWILTRYNSIREFALTIDMPYSTIDSIFKRGVENANVANIIRICEALSISADELAAGKITPRQKNTSTDEAELLIRYRTLNDKGRKLVRELLDALQGNAELLEYSGAPACSEEYNAENKKEK